MDIEKYYQSRSMASMINIATLSEARKIIRERYIQDYRHSDTLHAAIIDLELAFRRAIVAEAEYISKSEFKFS